MPLIKVEIKKGHSLEYKETFLKAVHEALVASLNIPENSLTQRLYEIEPILFKANESKTDKYSLIEVACFPGRSPEIKKAAIEAIYKILGERLQIAPSDITILILDPPLENWGLDGTQANQLNLQHKKP